MSKTIWVVYGTTGEYSDRSTWDIAAYPNEADAQAHADAATKFYCDERVFELRHKTKPINPYDKNADCDYTGTEWGIYPVELHEKFVTKEQP
jgi:hypothetical protein